MPNGIKYSTGATEAGCLRKGNMLISNNTADTGNAFYTGINPPAGGYTIYLNKASGGPSIYCPANDTQLISITNQIAGASYTTAAQCLDYFASQTDKIVVNFNYEGIVTNGLVLNLDAGFRPSYSSTGTTWYDISGNNNSGSLINGPTFDPANSGSIVFDGTDDRIGISSNSNLNFLGTSSYSIQVWGNLQSTGSGARMMVSRENSIGVGRDGYNFLLTNMNATTVSLGAERFASNVQSGISIQINTSLVLNKWCQFVTTYDGQFYKLYFNGNLIGTSTSITTNITNTVSQLSIGNRGTGLGNFINMNMSLILIYNQALTATEVTQNYNAQKGRFGL